MIIVQKFVDIFPPAEYAILQQGITAMLDDIDAASHQSADPAQVPRPAVIHTILTGRRGRPRKELNREFLETALELRGPQGISAALGGSVSSRTVRRRALDYGLAEACPPVFDIVLTPEGPTAVHTSSTAPVANISDDDLDASVSAILTTFPTLGRSMLDGGLRAQGLQVPRERAEASYQRVHGAPAIFGNRQILRKQYHVPGPMSLAHMDGQHGKSLCLRS